MEQRWRARWLEDGKEREYLFYSVKERLVARIDFRLKLAEAGTPCPEVYELEEASYGQKEETLVASDEKYLWVFTFELHTRWHIWCAYFQGQQEAEGFVQKLLDTIPCVHLLALEEYTRGLMLRGHLFPYHYSRMRQNEAQCEQPLHRRDLQMFPVAPLISDYLPSLLSRLGGARYCPQCEGKWFVLEESAGFAHRCYVKSARKQLA